MNVQQVIRLLCMAAEKNPSAVLNDMHLVGAFQSDMTALKNIGLVDFSPPTVRHQLTATGKRWVKEHLLAHPGEIAAKSNLNTYQFTANQLILLLQHHRGRRPSDCASDPACVVSDDMLLQQMGLLLPSSAQGEDRMTKLGTAFVRRLQITPIKADTDAELEAAVPTPQTPGTFVSDNVTIVLDHVTSMDGDIVRFTGPSTATLNDADIESFTEALRKHQALKHTHSVTVDMSPPKDVHAVINVWQNGKPMAEPFKPSPLDRATEEANRQRARAHHLEGILNDMLARAELAKMRMTLPQGDAHAGQG